MPGMLGSNQRAAQAWNASGEATEQAQLPTRFRAAPQPSSPLSDHLAAPVDHLSFFPGQPNAVVKRWPRMNGMRYLYASGMTRMPVPRLGANAIPRPASSAYQPNSHGPIHNAGFSDRYFETGTLPNGIGWPGRANLGLSFKVPQADRSATAANVKSTGPKSGNPVSVAVNALRRATGKPRERG